MIGTGAEAARRVAKGSERPRSPRRTSTCGFPGDGKPKPVVFPDPARMTAAHRPRDLDDVIQLIRVNRLPRDYAEQLDPYVRVKFLELWDAAQVDEDY